MGIYNDPVVNKVHKGGEWYCPLCDSTFASEQAFDVHQSTMLTDRGWLCHSAARREMDGLVRDRGIWYVGGETA